MSTRIKTIKSDPGFQPHSTEQYPPVPRYSPTDRLITAVRPA